MAEPSNPEFQPIIGDHPSQIQCPACAAVIDDDCHYRLGKAIIWIFPCNCGAVTVLCLAPQLQGVANDETGVQGYVLKQEVAKIIVPQGVLRTRKQ